MNAERIREIARQAIREYDDCKPGYETRKEMIEQAIRQAVAEQIEADAKIADYYALNSTTAKNIAQAIRARGLGEG